MRILVCLLLLPLGLQITGCTREYTIDSGLWELRFTDLVKRYTEGTRIKRMERLRDQESEVEVVLNHAYDRTKEADLETIEVYEQSPHDPSKHAEVREHLPPLTGWFEASTRKGFQRVHLEGRDTKWHFRMTADVFKRDRLKGTLWGRPVYDDNVYVTGTWEMVKLEDKLKP